MQKDARATNRETMDPAMIAAIAREVIARLKTTSQSNQADNLRRRPSHHDQHTRGTQRKSNTTDHPTECNLSRPPRETRPANAESRSNAPQTDNKPSKLIMHDLKFSIPRIRRERRQSVRSWPGEASGVLQRRSCSVTHRPGRSISNAPHKGKLP